MEQWYTLRQELSDEEPEQLLDYIQTYGDFEDRDDPCFIWHKSFEKYLEQDINARSFNSKRKQTLLRIHNKITGKKR